MKVKLTEGSHLVIGKQEYRSGDTLELDDKSAEVQLNAGIVEPVKVKKSKEK